MDGQIEIGRQSQGEDQNERRSKPRPRHRVPKSEKLDRLRGGRGISFA
jgi:hypothetical protein